MSLSFDSVHSQKSTNAAKPGTWDKPVPTDPIQGRIDDVLCEFKTFSFHPDYRTFSPEEHRLEDYKHGKGRNAAHIANPGAKSFFPPDSKVLIKKTLVDKGQMQLLQGSGVEIQVGTKTTSSNCDESDSFKAWCLPVNLISHYSPYLKETCSSSVQESNKRIRLHDHSPGVFGLFVEWMYYGSYESSSSVSINNADAKCWVLGDKLRSIEFQNYAMRRLHEQHTRPMFGRPVTCDDVQYVWCNTSPGSKLRNFYMHFVVEHFGSPAKLLGSSTDWDTVLQNQSEIRIQLLDKFRKSIFSPTRVERVDEYLEPNNSPSIFPVQQKSEPIQSATDVKTANEPIFNFGEKYAGKKSSPQQVEPFLLTSRTKNYEGAAVKFGWKLGDSTDNLPTPGIKAFQPKQDSTSELEAETAHIRGNQSSTSVGNSDDKSPEARKGKEPVKASVNDNKESG
ncbi:sdr family [Fusarium mundagurra]|uniref:Sdr family n=1 Tax=Fusarium mundagurra TaxID=1567541 RepID=A0A8H6D990_9HYPO|nr:sdr family [Fusarium mundagurra]